MRASKSFYKEPMSSDEIAERAMKRRLKDFTHVNKYKFVLTGPCSKQEHMKSFEEVQALPCADQANALALRENLTKEAGQSVVNDLLPRQMVDRITSLIALMTPEESAFGVSIRLAVAKKQMSVVMEAWALQDYKSAVLAAASVVGLISNDAIKVLANGNTDETTELFEKGWGVIAQFYDLNQLRALTKEHDRIHGMSSIPMDLIKRFGSDLGLRQFGAPAEVAPTPMSLPYSAMEQWLKKHRALSVQLTVLLPDLRPKAVSRIALKLLDLSEQEVQDKILNNPTQAGVEIQKLLMNTHAGDVKKRELVDLGSVLQTYGFPVAETLVAERDQRDH